MNIAILLGYPEISGGTNVILEHALGLTRLGHRVSIVTEVPFDPQRLSWKPGAADLPLLCHADCRERMFDLSLATWWRSVYDLPFVPARRYAYFVQSIESRFFSPLERDMKALVDYTYRLPLALVTEASWIQRYLRDHYGRFATLVRNGIEKSIFRPDGDALAARPDTGLRVLVEGALGVPFKRVDMSVRLCRRAGIDDLWLLTPSACEHYPGVSRLLSRVPMPQVGAVYRSCDVLVKISTVEGMFGPPLEMMHCGGTAITSDVTGHDEYMRHGENGIVVPRGREHEVIGYLRSLRADRTFLEKLRQGATATAAGWPDWPQAVAEMERFLVDATAPGATPDFASDQTMQLLRAALQLAGPLHAAVRHDDSGRELLKRLRDKATSKLKRKLREALRLESPGAVSVLNGDSEIALAAERRPRSIPARQQYRIAFVGDAARFHAHGVSCGPRLLTHWFSPRERGHESLLPDLSAFGPEICFVFQPEELPGPVLAQMPGFVVGLCGRDLNAQLIHAYRGAFPASAARRALLPVHSDDVATLQKAGIHAPASFLWPVDAAEWARFGDFQVWQSRRIRALLVGEPSENNRAFLTVLRRAKGFVHVLPPTDEDAIRPIVQNAQLVFHCPRGSDPAMDAAKIVRDMLCGCVVLADELGADYGMMPGEHYVHIASPEELERALAEWTRLPDAQDVIRRNGHQRALQFDAASSYLGLIEGPLSDATGTQQESAIASH